MTDQKIKKFIFSQTSLLKVQQFLDQNKDIDFREYKLNNKSNIVHHLSFNGQASILRLYLDYTENVMRHLLRGSEHCETNAKKQLQEWINRKNQQGYTPLLYASFNGHVQILQMLIIRGANFTIKNSQGQNSLHLAAQNNKVQTLIYFNNKLDINQQDNAGITPLHVASYSGSEDTVAYLLTLENINMELLDHEQQTPLLLATTYGNTKIVRRLLMKGAKRNVRNAQGKLAIQIAQESNFQNIKKMLDDRQSVCTCIQFYYNVKVQYKPTKRSLKMPVVYILTAVLALAIIHYLMYFKNPLYYIPQASIILLMFILYLSLLKGPRIPSRTQLLPSSNYNLQKICFECCRKKPKRSYHCDICNVCIEQYDHHCTWINNCVGKNNIGRFVTFVFFICLALAMIGGISLYSILDIMDVVDRSQFRNIILWRSQDEVYSKPQIKWIYFSLLLINVLISLFLVPVAMLFVVQVKNLLQNTTTYEQARGQTNKMSLSNCIKMCRKTHNRQSLQTDSTVSADDRLLSR